MKRDETDSLVQRLRFSRLGRVGILREHAAEGIETLWNEKKSAETTIGSLHDALYEIVHATNKNKSAKWCRERAERALGLEA